MVIGIFLLIHDEIKGPQISNYFFNHAMELSPDLLSKLYMAHASFNDSSFIETKYPQYKIVSLYTGPVARIQKQEGILGLLLDLKEELPITEIFLIRTLPLILKHRKNELMKELITITLPYFQYLLKCYMQLEIENISEFFLVQGQDDYQQVMLDFGSTKTDSSIWKNMYHQMVTGKDIPQYQYLKIEMPMLKKSSFFFGFKYLKKLPNLELFISTMAKFLIPNPGFILELIGMVYFGNLVCLIPKHIYQTLIWSSSSIKLDKTQRVKMLNLNEIMKKSSNYADTFAKHVNSVLLEEFYVLLDIKK